MPRYTQAGRPLRFASPLGPDALLLESLTGEESISHLYQFQLELLAEPETDIAFDQVLGQAARIDLRMADGSHRFVNGIVNRFSQGAEVRGPDGDITFIRYRAVLVPRLWLLTRQSRSRIFQQKSVPEILKAVLGKFDPKMQLLGKYEPRDFCVQYRESDFAFASRLMEEEGIYYYFQHTEDGPEVLVLSDHAQAHADVPELADLIYETVEGGNRPGDRIHAWEKTQEIRTGRFTLWDHCFEAAHQTLEAQERIQPAVAVGTVNHSLRVGGSDRLEVYDFPGGYAQRFDGVDPGGTPRPDDIEKIFADNNRTTRIRAQQESVQTLLVNGESNCRQLTAGHAFMLGRHFNADGKYVLTGVEHTGTLGGVYTGGAQPIAYKNRFRCIPAGLPFRPQQQTPRPLISGTQTAEVVGPSGEEIFTDKYGRVKVQFFWDREGKHDENSSCWVRVSQVHAGKKWGGIDIPRVGEEVIVAFEEGDPDRPIVVGRVYNAREMPPFGLPGAGMVSGLKSNTYPGGGGSNELSMDDTKGKERMYIHAQFDQDEVVENDQTSHVKMNRTKTVDVDEKTTIGNNRSEKVGVDEDIEIGANRKEKVGANEDVTIGGNQNLSIALMKNEMIGISSTETVGAAKTISVGGMMAITVGAAMNTAVGLASAEEVGLTKTIVAGVRIDFICGAAKISMEASGKITISGNPVVIEGGSLVDIDAGLIDLN